jgi:uncharacterized membrane protein YkvA (DUF1232 family)
MDYYQLLGVDTKAEPVEIRRAYREKLKEWHPDKNPDRRREAEEMTKTLNMAYGVLSAPEQRKNYDRMLRFSKGKDFNQYVNDSSFSSKIEKAAGPLRHIIRDVKDLYNLSKDVIKGDYKTHPVNMGIIAGGLLYFIIPLDLIPDYIPFFGLVDDAALLTTIINSLQGELTKYRNWKIKS